MIDAVLRRGGDRPLSILALGAHSDDLEIGCGGTVLELTRRAAVDVTWIVFGAAGERSDEAEASAGSLLEAARSANIVVEGFEDAFFPDNQAALKRRFEEIKTLVTPDVVLTHTRDDLHQDHRVICELTWNTFRDHLILEYEIPKYDGDLGRPNVFVHLTDDIAEQKIEHLLRHFPSQAGKRWFTPDMFRSMLRIRGMESNAPSGLAEAFHARKLVLAGPG